MSLSGWSSRHLGRGGGGGGGRGKEGKEGKGGGEGGGRKKGRGIRTNYISRLYNMLTLYPGLPP